jgi:general secretion pathway protein F
MVSFRYRALTAAGTVVAGVIEAPSREAAVQHLHSLGQFPISARTAGAAGWRRHLARPISLRQRLATRDLALASHELAMLLRAGLPLDRALEVTAGFEETRRLRAPLGRVLARVRDGAGLADALAAEEGLPRLFVAMVRAGEMGGSLEESLMRLADYLAKAQAAREAIISALIYPTILLVTSGLSITVILVFVLPTFEPLFASAGMALPSSTRFVMAIAHFLRQFWWTLAAASAALGIALRWALGRAPFRRRVDAALLRLPLLGGLLVKIELERFGRTLGTLLRNGVPLSTALGITKDTLTNSVVAGAVAETAASLREGEGLADRLRRTGVFPAIALDLLRVGEETGRVEDMLVRQADIAEQSVKRTTERLLALLVPVLTVVLGCIVAGLIASMLTAILSINNLALQ